MKIGEILEAIKTEKIADLAKRIEGISEKPLRTALKKAGYEFSNAEPKGWHFTGTGEEPLEKSIFEYHTKAAAKSRQTETQKSNNKENNKTKKTENHDTINSNKQESRETIITENHPTNQLENKQFEQATIQETRKPVKKVTYEIDENLHYEYRMAAFRQKKNVSELVEQAMREYLENHMK